MKLPVISAILGFIKRGHSIFWHSKFNRQNTRIMQIIRCIFPPDEVEINPDKKGRNPSVLTLKTDGSTIRETVTRQQWSYGGHHPNWHPDGEHIIMNLTPKWLGESS